MFQFPILRIPALRSGDYYDIDASCEFVFVEPVYLPKPAAYPVADNRLTYLIAYRDADLIPAAPVFSKIYHQIWRGGILSL